MFHVEHAAIERLVGEAARLAVLTRALHRNLADELERVGHLADAAEAHHQQMMQHLAEVLTAQTQEGK
jgi:DNA-binding transcriptional ArsR family regulator